VKSQQGHNDVQQRYRLKATGKVLITGRAIGQKIGSGRVRIVGDISEMDQVQPGDVLVTDMTDPNWEPVMKRAAAIVTNRGGRTCHAAIIARELGIPAVVGCGDATETISSGATITVDCSSSSDGGLVLKGAVAFDVSTLDVAELPSTHTKVLMILGNPDTAFEARLVFVIF
jgi:pyruvate,water dikinase